jgi:hypothetical protein
VAHALPKTSLFGAFEWAKTVVQVGHLTLNLREGFWHAFRAPPRSLASHRRPEGRSPLLPEVPAIAEAGVPTLIIFVVGMDTRRHSGRSDRQNSKNISHVLALPNILAWFAKHVVVCMTQPEFSRFV